MQDTAAEEGAGKRTHDPAVAAVEEAVQHSHAPQPLTIPADAMQQHPPMHTSLAQSKRLAHASPGGRKKQDPVWREQPLHPARTADGLQHAPSRHERDAHEAELVHGAPGGRSAGEVTVGAVVGEDAAITEALSSVHSSAAANVAGRQPLPRSIVASRRAAAW